MLPVLQVGPAAIQLPGLILLVGLWTGLVISEKFSWRSGLSSAQLYNLVFSMLVAGLVGARLFLVISAPQAFIKNPLSIISLNPGLLDFWGGILAAVLAGLVYTRRKKLSLLSALDALTPLLATLAIAISLSNLAAGRAYGSPANLPWSIDLWGKSRHPVQVYAALAGTAILLYLWPGRWRYEDRRPGEYFLTFVALSAGAVLFLEYFRGDSQLMPGGLREKQLAAWIVLAACLFALRSTRRILSPTSQE